MTGPIERLKATRWWKPALRKFASYVQAHRKQNCAELQMDFTAFAFDVLNTPEVIRDEMLEVDEVESKEPIRCYRQYEPPKKSEMPGNERDRDKGRRR